MVSKHVFGCDKCHLGIVVYPPSDEYVEIIEQPCPKGDSKEFKIACRNQIGYEVWCETVNTRHWHKRHTEQAAV